MVQVQIDYIIQIEINLENKTLFLEKVIPGF